MTDAVAETAGKFGWAINAQKTEVMGVGEDPPQVTRNGKNFGSVECFTYLESKISSNGDRAKELSGRIGMVTGCFEKLSKIWQSNVIFKEVRMKR